MFGIGMSEMLIILAVALLVFGPQKLPEIAKSIAKGLKELRRAGDDLRSSVNFDLDDDKPARRPPRPLAKTEPPAAIAGSELANALTPAAAAAEHPGASGAPPSPEDDAAARPARAGEPPLEAGWPKPAEGTTSRDTGDDLDAPKVS